MKLRALIAAGLGLGLSLSAQLTVAQQSSSPESDVPDDRTFHTTRSGKEVIISVAVQWDRNCVALPPPRLILKTPPAHGSVCVRMGLIRLPHNNAPDGAIECLGKRTTGLRVIYNPQPGYVGPDIADYVAEFPWKRRWVHAEIDVRPGTEKAISKPDGEPTDSDKPGDAIAVCAPLMS